MRLGEEVQALPRARALTRDIVWEWVGRAGLEHCRLATNGDAIRVEGYVVAAVENGTAALRYDVECDTDWRFRQARIEIDGAVHRIAHDGAGWRVDGEARPDLADCVDIDIRLTPFTNTLPIRRLALAPDAPVRLAMAYVHLPDFNVSRTEQEYTGLGERRFRYHGLGTGFTAILTTDEDGIVVDYGDIWRRRAPLPDAAD